MLFRFVGFIYLKFIALICLDLQLFFMGVEILKYIDDLPQSANLVVLFLAWVFLYAINYTFPIAVILASVAAYIVLVKSNNLTAILSIGYSKKRILAPLIVISVILNLAYIALNATPFVYAEENIENIIYRSSVNDAKSDFLVKYDDDYVYMEKIFPLLQKAQNIKVFEIENFVLTRFIEASEAEFDGAWWNLKNATITTLPKDLNFKDSKLKTEQIANYQILQDFKPKILDTIYQNKPNISIYDAISAMKLLVAQNSSTDKIRAILYAFFAIPVAIPLAIVIMSYFVPSLARYSNLAKLGFIFVLFCLVVWGIFFMLTKLAISGFLPPEFGIIVPLVAFATISLGFYRRI